jgi:hypothetical protein
MNTRMNSLLALGIGAAMAAGVAIAQTGQYSGTRNSQLQVRREMNTDQTNLQSAMRKLWEDHTTWTRMFIISAVNNLPNKEATAARLMQNQVDIGDAMKPIYGDLVGSRLTALLKDHISTAADIISAAKRHDSNEVADQKQKWYGNSDQIADVLSNANPRNWSRSEMRSMMREHLDATLEEAVAELNGDFRTSVRKYDLVHTQILMMADMLTEGIISQFPEKYATGIVDTHAYTAGYSSMRMDSGAVLPFILNQKLSSNNSSVGDRFTANLDTDEYSDYQGMATGAILEGHVDVARAKKGTTPGVLGLAFDRVRMPDGQTYKVYGSLIGLDSKSVSNDNGRLTAKSAAKNDNLKWVGYGAGGGALLSVITKGNIITNALIGGALGYLYGEIQKNPSKSRNVTTEAGTKFGVRLTRDLSFRAATSGNR